MFLVQHVGRFGIEERIPLKQGLKRHLGILMEPLPWIEERIPLKQGLKLDRCNDCTHHNFELKKGFH